MGRRPVDLFEGVMVVCATDGNLMAFSTGEKGCVVRDFRQCKSLTAQLSATRSISEKMKVGYFKRIRITEIVTFKCSREERITEMLHPNAAIHFPFIYLPILNCLGKCLQ